MVDKETKNKLQATNLAGIGFEDKFGRYYPEASLSAHILGFVGKKDNGEDIGYFGVEGYYDKDLAGLPGFLKSDRDLLDKPILIGTQEKIDPEDGRDLYLTIDKSVQQIVKKKLLQGMEAYKPKEGCVIVADPYTMAIMALVCLPDFDLDRYYQFNESFFKNPAISSLYEPGSIFKPLIMAAGIEEKSIKPDEIYNEEGPIQIGEYTIRTWDNKYEGKISMSRILEKSSNVGMVYIGNKLGKDKIYSYLKKYGFGKLTNIDLQGEVSGYLKDKNEWYPIDYATVTFGQGIVATPLQMITAFSSIINEGKLLRPYIVAKAVSNNQEKVAQPKLVRQTISPKTSAIIRKMLTDTVEHGEVRWAKPQGYKIGGKTGTAQIAIEGRYDPSKTIASFIGFAPSDRPKFIVLVVLKEPQTSIWGSETAAPLFFDIAKELLVYYNIHQSHNLLFNIKFFNICGES
jgi:cell division protein FtsI/penicillin-binding protein 2